MIRFNLKKYFLGLSDGEPIKKEMGKMLKQSPEKGKVSVSDPLSSGKLIIIKTTRNDDTYMN